MLYADDFLSGTSDMTPEEVGAYIRLLCHQWSKGYLPNDPERLARMAGAMDVPSLRYVLAKFVLQADGTLRNERLESVRRESEEYRTRKSASGRAGAQKRWQTKQDDGGPNGTAMDLPLADPLAQDGSPAPAPAPIKEEEEEKASKASLAEGALKLLGEINAVTGRDFRPVDSNLSIIKARLREPGVTVEGCVAMIRRQAAKWLPDTRMAEYVRPATLFGKEKFDGYYSARELETSQKPAGDPFPARQSASEKTNVQILLEAMG